MAATFRLERRDIFVVSVFESERICNPVNDNTYKLEQSILSEIRELQPEKKPNLLMLGPVGAGKSSFINSILSIGKGRKCALAATGDTGDASWTLDLGRYTEGSLLRRYRLFDSMGIEPCDGHGFHTDDLTFLIKGHVKNGYMFNPASPITKTSSYFRRNPTFQDQMHCVIFVMSATAIHAGIPSAYVQKIKQLQDKITREHIPRILILTKVDELCDEVAKDITKMFWSVKVQDVIKAASEMFGIEQSSIHPVKNYEVDFDIETQTNIPLLLALRQTMQYAADRIQKD
ncbi:interferon-induced protein 44-like isoform X3 [Ruditapes philippinarum]|uniref:interferon-induced protein 44-like isoform X3 n=1 Tax=Ruditapes philippinarum TaxID=129788 RepID=UPI00295C3409|nr:interferon-induced protein 44-like isoform X3 [Ruditapes philippinarum]